MRSRWSDDEAAGFVSRHGPGHGEALALRTYTSRLLGAEPELVLHGGGNTSVKGEVEDLFGERREAIFVKASGHDLADIAPEGHVAVDLAALRRLRELPDLPDVAMVRELRARLHDPDSPTPSIETPVHAFVPARYVDHTHADAILALTNQRGGEARVREALGEEVAVLPYVHAGFRLALEVARALDERPDATAMVWLRHGLLTWGESARESYERTIELVTRAEAYLAGHARVRAAAATTPPEEARRHLVRVAPVLRGLLAEETGDPDRPRRPGVLRAITTPEALAFVDAPGARERAVSPPLTADHLIRTKALPAWAEGLDFDDDGRLREQLAAVLDAYAADYRGYLERNAARLPEGVEPFDARPRVVMIPGVGVVCAGDDARAAGIARDITAHTLAAKAKIAALGASYQGLDEAQLFAMEYRVQQVAKLGRSSPPALAGRIALVTGAAGAIGSAICEGLLAAGAHVAATDLPGPRLDALVGEQRTRHGERARGVALDVTEPASVAAGLAEAVAAWGGLDLVVINAGLAHVASLEELDLGRYAEIERVNTHGTLHLLREAAPLLRRQGIGGDVVLVSTKNVFAPGARFGAYSATKAAAHQLARIASLELAEHDVRVNMVSPDAVFAHGERRSGLWAEVGPDRMRARGLDEQGLEAYYRDRNLLKARVEARHVANAVLFFATRQTPTTGATLPVDGGLPDSTPR